MIDQTRQAQRFLANQMKCVGCEDVNIRKSGSLEIVTHIGSNLLIGEPIQVDDRHFLGFARQERMKMIFKPLITGQHD